MGDVWTQPNWYYAAALFDIGFCNVPLRENDLRRTLAMVAKATFEVEGTMHLADLGAPLRIEELLYLHNEIKSLQPTTLTAVAPIHRGLRFWQQGALSFLNIAIFNNIST